MKNRFTNLLLVLAVIFMSVSCSKDDDNSGGSHQNLSTDVVGKWKYTQNGELDDDGNEVLSDYYHNENCDKYDYLAFFEDRTGEDVIHYSCSPQADSFTWSTDGNILTISEDWMVVEYEVKEISASNMKVYMEYEFQFNDEIYIETYIYVFEKTNN